MGLTYAFTCPTCDERTLVDDAVREMLLDGECPVCGTPIVEEAFEVTDEPTR